MRPRSLLAEGFGASHDFGHQDGLSGGFWILQHQDQRRGTGANRIRFSGDGEGFGIRCPEVFADFLIDGRRQMRQVALGLNSDTLGHGGLDMLPQTFPEIR